MNGMNGFVNDMDLYDLYDPYAVQVQSTQILKFANFEFVVFKIVNHLRPRAFGVTPFEVILKISLL